MVPVERGERQPRSETNQGWRPLCAVEVQLRASFYGTGTWAPRAYVRQLPTEQVQSNQLFAIGRPGDLALQGRPPRYRVPRCRIGEHRLNPVEPYQMQQPPRKRVFPPRRRPPARSSTWANSFPSGDHCTSSAPSGCGRTKSWPWPSMPFLVPGGGEQCEILPPVPQVGNGHLGGVVLHLPVRDRGPSGHQDSWRRSAVPWCTTSPRPAIRRSDEGAALYRDQRGRGADLPDHLLPVPRHRARRQPVRAQGARQHLHPHHEPDQRRAGAADRRARRRRRRRWRVGSGQAASAFAVQNIAPGRRQHRQLDRSLRRHLEPVRQHAAATMGIEVRFVDPADPGELPPRHRRRAPAPTTPRRCPTRSSHVFPIARGGRRSAASSACR